MRPCNVWIYIDATGPTVRVEYESTCDCLYRCGADGCSMVSVSSKFTTSLKFSNLESLLPLTPSNPTLWQPFPPYRSADVSVVVDSDPKSEIYGLPARKSVVVTLTKRTVLEGVSPLQLVSIGGADEVLGESEALVSGWLGFEVSYPLLPKVEGDVFEESIVWHCHHAGEISLWGKCLYEHYTLSRHVREYLARLRKVASHRKYGADVVAMLMRLYAGIAVASGFAPLELAEIMASHDLFTPIVISDDEIKAVHPRLRVGVKCSSEGVEFIAEADKLHRLLREYKCNSVALICRRCWQKIDELRGERNSI